MHLLSKGSISCYYRTAATTSSDVKAVNDFMGEWCKKGCPWHRPALRLQGCPLLSKYYNMLMYISTSPACSFEREWQYEAHACCASIDTYACAYNVYIHACTLHTYTMQCMTHV